MMDLWEKDHPSFPLCHWAHSLQLAEQQPCLLLKLHFHFHPVSLPLYVLQKQWLFFLASLQIIEHSWLQSKGSTLTELIVLRIGNQGHYSEIFRHLALTIQAQSASGLPSNLEQATGWPSISPVLYTGYTLSSSHNWILALFLSFSTNLMSYLRYWSYNLTLSDFKFSIS